MILITGASGMIGRALAARLLMHGVPVRLQGRSAESVASALYDLSVSADLEIVRLDFATADQPDYDRLAAGCTTFVHCGGLVHNPIANAAQHEALNFRATQMLASAARRAKAEAFVFLSTSAVYGSGPFNNLAEEAETRPDTPYAVSKLRAEQWLKENESAARTIILRPSLVFGEGDRGNMLSLIRQIDKGLFFHIGGNRARKSVIYAVDVAHAIQRCLDELAPGYHLLNVANPQPISVVELCNEIAFTLGKPAPPTVPEMVVRAGAMFGGAILGDKSPLTVEKMQKLMSTTTCSIERLVSTTGFSPTVSLREGLSAEIQWARQKGLLPSGGEFKSVDRTPKTY